MDRKGRSTPARRLAVGLVGLVALTLPASAVVQSAATRANSASGTANDRGLSASQLTAAQNPPALPARGAGAAATTAADPAAAGLPGAASVTVGPGAIPAMALAAYRKAAATLAVEDPSCHLSWPLLAGIGKVETDHGRSWGSASRITATGEVVPTILGPLLDGKNGTALLLDTDGGAYDQNRQYDRAVGPMQFVPSTWAELGRDGNGDGVKDPNNIWDATLAAAGYLCGGSRDLNNPADLRSAVLAYNPSSAYVRAVLAWASAYRKAGANLPALDGVPDPLVLGAGGIAGEDPFGDPITYGDTGGFTDSTTVYGVSDPGGPANLVGDGSTPSSPVVTPTPSPQPTDARTSPSPSPSPKPPKPTKSSRSPKPSLTPTPSPTQTPSPTPTPTPTQTPTPIPTPTATPTPSPTPTAPVCENTGITVAPSAAVSAVPVDTNQDGAFDVLRVTVPVSAAQAGTYTVGVRLTDAQGYRVTSLVMGVTLNAGSQDVVADLPGQDIGDAGASGADVVRVTVRDAGAAATCAQVLLAATGTGTIDASGFAGWFTTLERLNQRLAQDIASGLVSDAAATALPQALLTPSAAAPDLAAFRMALAGTASVSGQELIRLDSLAARLITQGSTPGTATTLPLSDDLDPSADGVG
jgi:membrane-bound lytic murein transglycosylase B